MNVLGNIRRLYYICDNFPKLALCPVLRLRNLERADLCLLNMGSENIRTIAV